MRISSARIELPAMSVEYAQEAGTASACPLVNGSSEEKSLTLGTKATSSNPWNGGAAGLSGAG